MPYVKLLARARNNRPVSMPCLVRRSRFDDSALIEEDARAVAEENGVAYMGWEYDDHPLTIHMDEDVCSSAEAAVGGDPENSLLRSVVGIVSDDWKARLKKGDTPETLRAELLLITSYLERIAVEPQPELDAAPGMR